MADESGKISILLVDDMEDKLISMEAVLDELGLDIVRATSGREALRHLLHRDFAAILLDVNMPGMDGFETATLIRQRKNSEKTPILFITALSDDHFVSRGYSLGAVDYILTPVVPDILRTKVTVFVDLYRNNLKIRLQAQALEERANQLSALTMELAQAEQRERRRLAQILHDHLQQLLVAAKMRLGMLGNGLNKQDAQTIALVNELLSNSIEASRSLTVQLSPPVLYDVGFISALEWLARQMKKDHNFTVDVEGERDAEFAAEDLRAFAFQAVRELLFNVLKHAGVGGARVAVARGIAGYLSFTVEDSGTGFDPNLLAAVSSRREHFGLFSIRERVKLMDGRLDLETAPGRGTKITVHLPDRQPAQTSRPESPDTHIISPNVPAAEGARIRVLLADDHEILRKGLIGLLESHPDIEVIGEAKDGFAAVDLARRHNPAVVVMDVAMPGLSGIEATRRIKKEFPDVQIIGLSMHNKEDMAAAMKLAGASVYLSKGGSPAVLIAAIREVGSNPRNSPSPTTREATATPATSGANTTDVGVTT